MPVRLLFALFSLIAVSVYGEPEPKWQHFLAIFDEPAYPEDFTHFNSVNPDAPKGGRLNIASHGTFDTLNPYTLKGVAPSTIPSVFRYGFLELNEPLMVGTGIYAPSLDHKNTAYGLIAEKVAWDSESKRLSFKLRPEARFHDGVPITTKDVKFSFETLLKHGSPLYKTTLEQVKSITLESPQVVHFHLKPASSAGLPLRISELPVLPEHYWKGKDFSKTTMKPPLLSGPYRITKVKQGKSITYERVRDYWGKDLPVNKGLYNFDQIVLNLYQDRHVTFQVFRNGNADIYYETEAKNWACGYDFPAVQNGEVIKEEIPLNMPASQLFFIFNLSRGIFKDRRVRNAISLMFDWDWSNKVIFRNAYLRNNSYFHYHSRLTEQTLPSEEEVRLLQPWQSQLPAELFTQKFDLPHSKGNGDLTQQKRDALRLLKQAGWHYQGGVMKNSAGEPLSFEFMHYSKSIGRFVLPFAKQLASIGITMNFRNYDASHFQRRLRQKDYDMTQVTIPIPYLPGESLQNQLHSESADQEGSQNLLSLKSPVVDELIEQIINAETNEQLETRVTALDRVLMWEHYTIPNWHTTFRRVAYWNRIKAPEVYAPYASRFTTWWAESRNN